MCIKTIKTNNIKLITSSENVFLCEIENSAKYVRIIRKHAELKDYIFETVDFFFDLIVNDSNLELFRKKALQDLKRRENYCNILQTEKLCQQYKKALVRGEFKEPELFGFPSLNSEKFLPYVCSFILFVRGELIAYQNNCCLKNNTYQTFGANLQCATKALAEFLDIGYLIPNIQVFKIQYKKKKFLATVMDSSPGFPANSIEMDKRKFLTADFIRSITNLEYFDALCYQTDHKQRNFNVVLDSNGFLTSVSAFDNDAPFTFLPFFCFPRKVSLITNFQPVYDRGKINRRYMDKAFAERLCSVKRDDLYQVLSNYLNNMQILAIWYRIKRLSHFINKTKEKDPSFFVDFDQTVIIDDLLPVKDYNKNKSDYLLNYLTNNEHKLYSHIKI